MSIERQVMFFKTPGSGELSRKHASCCYEGSWTAAQVSGNHRKWWECCLFHNFGGEKHFTWQISRRKVWCRICTRMKCWHTWGSCIHSIRNSSSIWRSAIWSINQLPVIDHFRVNIIGGTTQNPTMPHQWNHLATFITIGSALILYSPQLPPCLFWIDLNSTYFPSLHNLTHKNWSQSTPLNKLSNKFLRNPPRVSIQEIISERSHQYHPSKWWIHFRKRTVWAPN